MDKRRQLSYGRMAVLSFCRADLAQTSQVHVITLYSSQVRAELLTLSPAILIPGPVFFNLAPGALGDFNRNS